MISADVVLAHQLLVLDGIALEQHRVQVHTRAHRQRQICQLQSTKLDYGKFVNYKAQLDYG